MRAGCPARRVTGGEAEVSAQSAIGSGASGLTRPAALKSRQKSAGTASFKAALSNEDAEAIRAHIVSLANTAKSAPRGAGGFGGGPGGPGGPRGGAAAAGPRPPQPGGGMGVFATGPAQGAAAADQQQGSASGLHQ